jgi:hypothetical protein
MRLARFILVGMLLFSLVAVNISAPETSNEIRGTRGPGAGVNVTAKTENLTGIPTETKTYVFDVNNTGDENDTFDIFVDSENNWDYNVTHSILGPLEVNQTASVEVNITIPMGWPAGTWDNLSFRARSNNDFIKSDFVNVTTNVDPMFIISIDIEGDFERLGLIDEQNKANYTLTIKNKGNVDVTITLEHTLPTLPGWQVSFPDFPSGIVAIDAANLTSEFIMDINLTVQAPNNAQPDDMVTIVLWGKKVDITPSWYSWLSQENITITTTVQPVLEITFDPVNHTGYVDYGLTLFNFTTTNSGNKRVEIDLVAKNDLLLLTSIDHSHMTMDVGKTTDINILRVITAKNTPLGNYTINLTAEDSISGDVLGYVELYYIVVPQLNITDISLSSDDPIQYGDNTLSATIENIGYVDATNVTVRFYDGSKKINETILDIINASETEIAKVTWSPSDFGNRSIRVEISVEGRGNFSDHGTAISEKSQNFDVKINWQPYYLVIYIIIVIILAIGVISGLMELRYYGGIPHVNSYGENGEEEDYEDYPEKDYEEYPEKKEEPSFGLEEEEKRPFGTYGVTTEPQKPIDEPLRYDRPIEREYRPPPEPKPPRQEFAPPVDPETKRVEYELRDEIARVQDDLDKTKSQGVDTSKIDQLLRTAKKNNAKAKQYIGYASERLKNLTSKRDEAVSAIKEAREVLSAIRGSTDLTIVENFLVKADSLLKDGDFREAINYAKKAKDRAQRLQRKEMRL